VLNLLGHTAPVGGVVFLPDGEGLVSVSWNGNTRIWDTTGQPDVIESFDAREGAQCIATLTRDGRAVVWKTGTGEAYRQARFDGAKRIEMDDGCRVVAVGHFDGGVVTAYLAGDEQPHAWQAHRGWLTSLAVSPDGKLLASAGYDGTVRIWNSRDGKLLHENGGFDYVVQTLSFSPDSRFLLSGDTSGEAVLWDIAGDRRVRLSGHSRTPWTVAWSQDGQWFATGSQDKTVRLWALPGGEPHHAIPHEEIVFGVEFAAMRQGGASLLTLSSQFAYQWDARDGSKIDPVLTGHENVVTAGTYSPDGSRIATVGWDRTARIWDAASGKEVAKYSHENPLVGTMFSPDGDALITISEAGEVRYIPLDAKRLLEIADERATRELTPTECKQYLNLASC
jgi:WD40 repeat protein